MIEKMRIIARIYHYCIEQDSNMASAKIIRKSPLTTAAVVWRPTLSAPMPVWNPRKQPTSAIRIAKTSAFIRPPAMSLKVMAAINLIHETVGREVKGDTGDGNSSDKSCKIGPHCQQRRRNHQGDYFGKSYEFS